MAQLADHPTVKRFHEQPADQRGPQPPSVLDAAWLHQVCLAAGADDAGFVEIDRPEISAQKIEALAVLPGS